MKNSETLKIDWVGVWTSVVVILVIAGVVGFNIAKAIYT